ncbi:sarcosine oxidase, gamma subunit family protein [Roseovarius nubinhibens ISM]|uniref:Sarcosine oxidase, gamma subunit family protein n=1 Tax=Roseovarius nubinhibens (strain ATCC BAA-591 / DSM 15170 / ISM) TaxID=89187 RepID=A3SMU3_ROSNI|nr:sarcosine oxidase, gamma subunit family protein [Roseovarius nubinhibens ISM]
MEGGCVTELTAKTPGAGIFPFEIGGITAREETPEAMTAIAPYKGREAEASAALEAAHGMALPAPGRSTGKAGARALWFGRDTALLIGPRVDASLGRHAALTDQSDAWIVVRLEGAGARDVLARLTPLDLREGVFKRGHTARSELAHMAGSITRVGPEAWQIMVFRSFARTLAHDLDSAMRGVAARAGA